MVQVMNNTSVFKDVVPKTCNRTSSYIDSTVGAVEAARTHNATGPPKRKRKSAQCKRGFAARLSHFRFMSPYVITHQL